MVVVVVVSNSSSGDYIYDFFAMTYLLYHMTY